MTETAERAVTPLPDLARAAERLYLASRRLHHAAGWHSGRGGPKARRLTADALQGAADALVDAAQALDYNAVASAARAIEDEADEWGWANADPRRPRY